MMQASRREVIRAAGFAALNGALALDLPGGTASAQVKESDFAIDEAFAGFMRDIGGSPADCGGAVTFVGRDPILRSRFRIAASMALPAMAAGVGAAAIWKERTGEGQDLRIDLRESIYNINPVIGLILRYKQSVGLIPVDDPIPKSRDQDAGVDARHRWFANVCRRIATTAAFAQPDTVLQIIAVLA